MSRNSRHVTMFPQVKVLLIIFETTVMDYILPQVIKSEGKCLHGKTHTLTHHNFCSETHTVAGCTKKGLKLYNRVFKLIVIYW